MREAAVENLQEAAERLQEIAGSEEFEKARDDLVDQQKSCSKDSPDHNTAERPPEVLLKLLLI